MKEDPRGAPERRAARPSTGVRGQGRRAGPGQRRPQLRPRRRASETSIWKSGARPSGSPFPGHFEVDKPRFCDLSHLDMLNFESMSTRGHAQSAKYI